MPEIQVLFLGRENPLEWGMKTHSNILACKIRGQESLAGTVHGVAKSQAELHMHAHF